MKQGLLLAIALLLTVGILSCGGPTKLERLQQNHVSVSLVLPQESDIPELEYRQAKRDTLVVKDEKGKDLIIMKAIRDEKTGEMVANDILQAAVVTARFRNIAERHGKVDLTFQVIVPAEMQDGAWQLRFYPDLFILEDSLRLEPVIITGKDYRAAQLKGYQQYEKFLAKIVSDTTKFIDIKQLELFLQRNIPQVYAFKTDTTEVSDAVFYSYYGVSEKQAIEYYTNHIAKWRNKRRIAKMGEMYRKYVKNPIASEGIRLDTVITNVNGDFIYNYTQTIHSRPKLRKVDILLSGDIYEKDRKIYEIPRSTPLTYYISSISSFADASEHYLTRVIERRAEANASYSIEFAKGKSDIQPSLGNNRDQIDCVKENLTDLLRNEVYYLDSIVIVANASPEGSWAANDRLSKRRGEAVVKYFEDFIRDYRRQVARGKGLTIDELGNISSEIMDIPNVRLFSQSVPENWKLLDRLVCNDPRLSEEQKESYYSHANISDKDMRESCMRGDSYYRFLADSLYPRLRVVDFGFHLHRKGMVKDTVHTTELDEHYMKGVQLLQDMEYDKAVCILGPYQDYNAAVAYMAAERNASAMLILQNLKRTPQVNYLLAILYSRNGDEQMAIQSYLEACRQDRSYVHRGNLDPEISQLIKLYGLNRQNEDDLSL